MKKTEKLLFLSLLFLTSCRGNVTPDSSFVDDTQTLPYITDKAAYTSARHYSEGVLHLQKQTVEDSYGLEHPFKYSDQDNYCPVSLYGSEGERLTKADFKEGEKIVFGWGGTSGKYDTLVTQEIWKGSESKITPFTSHTGKVRSIGNDCYEFVGDDSYEKTFRPDDITCLSRDNALVSFDASKTYKAFTSLNVKNSIDLIFLQEA